MKKRYLVLENGEIFEGYAFGADSAAVGELVFTTGMCGYIETLTDPSYCGQIVLQTFPLIGNYGFISADAEGKCFVKGYVVREYCETPSNFRCEETLDSFLKKSGIPGIYGIDTRRITELIREQGVMNAQICDTVPTDISEVKNFKITEAVGQVSVKEKQTFSVNGRFKVALIDYGAKKNIVRELNRRGCDVDVFPNSVSAEEILGGGYDGVMLSNGPGDPADNIYETEQIRKLFGKLPLFGICLGHQLTALSQGAETVKLKYGHRGVNQPVKETAGTRTYITSQNHGYSVKTESVKGGRVSYINANDGTCEGIEYPQANAFTVQFHPEACSGPHDTSFLFDRFCSNMER